MQCQLLIVKSRCHFWNEFSTDINNHLGYKVHHLKSNVSALKVSTEQASGKTDVEDFHSGFNK